jgi:hypothetical protein
MDQFSLALESIMCSISRYQPLKSSEPALMSMPSLLKPSVDYCVSRAQQHSVLRITSARMTIVILEYTCSMGKSDRRTFAKPIRDV